MNEETVKKANLWEARSTAKEEESVIDSAQQAAQEAFEAEERRRIEEEKVHYFIFSLSQSAGICFRPEAYGESCKTASKCKH